MRACWQSLMMHRFRSFLSLLGILIGVASLMTMLSIGEGTKREILSQIESLGLHNIFLKAHKPFNLPKIPGISLSTPLSPLPASISASFRDIHPEILATNTDLQPILNLEVERGRFLCDLDSKGSQQVCVIGADIAKQLGLQGAVGQSLRIDHRDYKIVGVLSRQMSAKKKGKALSEHNLNQAVLVPFTRGDPTEMIVKVDQISHIPQTAQLIQKRFDDDLQLVVPQELLRQAERSQRMFHLVLGMIAATSLLVGGIGIANVMMASVYERMKEIGIRRAVGATKQDIIKQFLGEALLLTVSGCFFGVILGSFFSFCVSLLSDWETVITFWSVTLSFFMALIVGVCAGVYPAFQASKVDPIVALR